MYQYRYTFFVIIVFGQHYSDYQSLMIKMQRLFYPDEIKCAKTQVPFAIAVGFETVTRWKSNLFSPHRPPVLRQTPLCLSKARDESSRSAEVINTKAASIRVRLGSKQSLFVSIPLSRKKIWLSYRLYFIYHPRTADYYYNISPGAQMHVSWFASNGWRRQILYALWW